MLDYLDIAAQWCKVKLMCHKVQYECSIKVKSFSSNVGCIERLPLGFSVVSGKIIASFFFFFRNLPKILKHCSCANYASITATT
jgi:hypothetical protein